MQTIAGLLADRTALLSEMITIEQREQRDLAEALHDGALQYVLGARQELDDLADGDPDAAHRIDVALTESARLLRTTMSQLHPAVIEATGSAAGAAGPGGGHPGPGPVRHHADQ